MESTINVGGAFIDRINVQPLGNGTLDGLTFAVKDVIDVAGTVTGCGNPTWAATHDPAVAHAVAVELLLQAGARCVGKTITDEFAFSLVGENHFYGTPKNHRAPDRVPGGSSSGSASAVAAGEVDFAIGTDTAGSVRVPAANCGLLGLRSTLGRHPFAGVQSLAPSFDTLGVFTRDAATMRQLGRLFYPVQSLSATKVFLLEEAWSLADADVRALRSVVDARFRELDLDVRVTRLDSLADDDLGRDLFAWKQLFSDVQWPEIWSVFGSWVERHASDIGPKIAENFHMVRERGRAGYAAAFKKRAAARAALQDFFESGVVLALPTVPSPPPLVGQVDYDRKGTGYLPRMLCLNAIAGIGGLPAINVPLTTRDGLPAGLTLIGAPWTERSLIRLAQDYMETQIVPA